MKRLTLTSAAFATLLSLFALSTPAWAGGGHVYGGGHFHGGGYHGYHAGYYHGGHCCVHGSVVFGFGVPWPGYYWGYGYPYYYGPPPYYGYAPSPYYGGYAPAASDPPQYIERSDVEGAPAPAQPQQQAPQSAPPPQSQEPQQTWWYWCQSSQKYWPYVKECTGGFQRVPAQPPAPAK